MTYLSPLLSPFITSYKLAQFNTYLIPCNNDDLLDTSSLIENVDVLECYLYPPMASCETEVLSFFIS